MKKIFIKIAIFVSAVLLVLTPFFVFTLVSSKQKHIYSKTYYAALVDKVHRLETLKNKKKIILIGGSNVAFGFESSLIEKEFPDYEVANFGLYAMLGTKIMMDLALDYVEDGDLVFVIPEINSQSTSLYFSAESTLKAVEDDMNIIWKLPKDNFDSVIGKYFDFVIERAKQKEIIQPSGVYQRSNFNKYGDIEYNEVDENGIPYRSANRMALHYDPTMMVDFDYKIDQSFFDYLNEYDSKIKSKKGSLFYSFSPLNEKSVQNKNSIDNYYWSIRNKISCKTIGNPSEYIIDPHYFYDSNFHLNDAGASLRSYIFIQDIYRDILHEAKCPSFPIPTMPEYIDEDATTDDSETALFFEYVDYEDCLLISGVKSDHANDFDIILPSVANGKKVIGIAKEAFKKCTSLEKIVIPSSISILMDGCFGNSTSLKKVYIETHKPSDIIVSYTGEMTNGTGSDFRIFIHNDCYTDFAADYYWGAYSSIFERY